MHTLPSTIPPPLPHHMCSPVLAQGSLTNLSAITKKSRKHHVPRQETFPPGRRRHRRPSSVGSPSQLQKLQIPLKQESGKDATGPNTPELDPHISGVFIPAAPNAEPGSAEWQYCSLPLGDELAKGLVEKWPRIEETYLKTLKGVFVMLRSEREAICQYFYLRR